MGGKTTSTSAPRLNQLSVQSSSLGLPITIGWGRGRAKCNLLDYLAFTATPHTTTTGGGKGGSKSQNTTYTYTASVILGLCEGGATGIQGIRTVYRDTSVFTNGSTTALAQAGLSLAVGTPTQAVWGYLTSLFPSHAINYSGIAYLYAQDYDLGDSATLPNHSFEIDFAIQLGGGVCDADPKDIITDSLTNSAYGVPGWTTGLIGDLSDFSLYCRANNLLLSPVLESQATMSDSLTEWTLAANSGPFFSEGVLKIRPYGDTAATGNGVTWTPNLTPAYDLTEDDFLENDAGPVTQTIVDQTDAYNIVQFEYLDRANQYNIAIAIGDDADNIAEFGERKMDPTTVHCICDAAIAQHSAQLYVQRVLYVRRQFKFQLPWSFVLLEPTDLVTLTTVSDRLKLNGELVRITEIEEDEEGVLNFTAEEVPNGTGAAAYYTANSGSGYQPNADIAPGSVSTPYLFLAPPELAGFNAEVWLAAASTSPTWGGCQVWISSDDIEYSMVGTVNGPARYGVLTSVLPSHVDPDNTNALAVNLSTSLGQLDGATSSAMDAGATLSIIRDELVSYQNASLTSAYHYSLSPLRRAQRGTSPGAHSIGDFFARLDDAIFKFAFDTSIIGDTIYVKLPSFNVFGRGLEDLATVTAYSINIASAPGRAGYRDVKFQRSLSQPATPTGDSPAGWYDGVPAGTDSIWQTVGTKSVNGTLIGVWSTPSSISGLIPRGAYSGAATYYLDNTVSLGGGSYIAVQDNFTGHGPSGTGQANAYWDVLSAPGDPGTPAIPPSGFSATINLTAGAAVNLRSVADANGYTGASNATITFKVPSGVTIRGLNSSGIGIDSGTWPTGSYTIALTLEIQSGGLVDGGGGNGGNGGGGAGDPGGDAIFCRVPMTVTIDSGGTVRGGGGGGGGGFTSGVGGKLGGGGGGGGAPNGTGGFGDTGYVTTGNDGTDGSTSGGGALGTPGGGNGGGFATAGSNSSNGGGPGGAAGFAVRKNGNTVTVTNSGTMTGTAA